MEDSFTNWIVLDSGEGKPLRANGWGFAAYFQKWSAAS